MFRLLFFFFAFLIFATPSLGQTQKKDITPITALDVVSEEQKTIDITQISKELAGIEKDVLKEREKNKNASPFSSSQKNATEQKEIIKKLSTIHDSLLVAKTQNNADLSLIQKKIAALGTPPETGEKESDDIAKQRKEFTKQADDVKGKIASIDLGLAKIDEINQLILKMRNQELLDTILVKRNSILNIEEFWKSLVSFSTFIYQLFKYPSEWYTSLEKEQQEKIQDQLILFSFWGSLCLLCAIFISWFIRKKFGYNNQNTNPNYSQKVMAAFFMILARGAVPSAIIGACALWISHHKALFSGNFGILLTAMAWYLFYLILSIAIIAVLFTPKKPQWRLIEVNDEKAKSLCSALIFSMIIICIFSFFHFVAIRLEYTADIIYALKMLANAAKTFCVILISYRFLYDNSSLTDEELEGDDIQALSKSSKLSILISLIALFVFGLSLAGYIRLAEYIFNHFFGSVIIVSICYIIRKLAVVLFHQLMSLRFWTKELRINKQGISKIEFWFSFIVTPIILILGVLALLGTWGVSVDIMLQNIKKFLIGFDIGGMRISIVSLILGIFAFFVTLFVVKFIKNSLLTGNLSKIDIDPGVRGSLASGLGFFGIIAAFFIAVSVMGGSFKGLAIVAGALSFGAGLGLQNVVNNFVSGLILIFERPVKIGDWVIINGHEGIVKQISMRSTQLETFNKANVIIPNADLLSNSLINMTYKSKTARIDILVGVGYNSNVSQVEDILLEIAKNTKNVLANPAPFIIFQTLGESSLNFQISCYTSDVNNKRFIQTAILENIITRFREENIEIPFPQRVVYLRAEETTQKEEIFVEKTMETNSLPEAKKGGNMKINPSEKESDKKRKMHTQKEE